MHQRWRVVAVVGFAALLCVGAVTRGYTAARPPVLCHSAIAANGQVTPEPLLPAATAGSPVWNTPSGRSSSPP
jgi:hypothetical protein